MHSEAAVASATDWGQILQLYDHLLSLTPGPLVALNRAVAVAEVEGPEAALALVDRLELQDHYLFHAVRGELYAESNQAAEAALSYRQALALTTLPAERQFLQKRLERCAPEASEPEKVRP